MRLNYIEENDISSFYYDELFKTYLGQGKTYKDLYSAIHYIVPRVLERNFLDEEGNAIQNKYGYFKNSLQANFRKLEAYEHDIYSDDDFCEQREKEAEGR